MQRFFLFIALFFVLSLPASMAGAYQVDLTPTVLITSLSVTPPAPQLPLESTPSISIPVIRFPLPGQALQGIIPIIGRTDLPGFSFSELTFSYLHNPTNTWFLIDQSDQPILDTLIAQWDTSTITDGIYNLRLTVYLDDGSSPSMIVEGIRVRNYTPIETNTPFSIIPMSTPVAATVVPSRAPVQPTSTIIPPNPLELDKTDVYASVIEGALTVLGLFALGALYWLLRSLLRRGLYK